MEFFKTYFLLHNPEARFLCSKANQKNTDGDIGEMGRKLAEEIRYYIKFSFPKLDNLKKITFLAHSLGGLITRAALPLLESYKEKMCSLITLSSPHLGCMYSESNLVSAGLWVLKKWYGAQSLEQLSFSDSPEFKRCFLYKLAAAPVAFGSRVGTGVVRERDAGELVPGLLLSLRVLAHRTAQAAKCENRVCVRSML